MIAVETDTLLSRFSALLDEERNVISNGDYDALTVISNQKMDLLGLLQDCRVSRENNLTLQAILEKSAENGLMVESALRFWRGAHQKLLRMQGQTTLVQPDRQINAYALYRTNGDTR